MDNNEHICRYCGKPTQMKPLRCDECGQFVGYKNIENGTAIRRIVTPDSAYTPEIYETLCPYHASIKRAHGKDIKGKESRKT